MLLPWNYSQGKACVSEIKLVFLIGAGLSCEGSNCKGSNGSNWCFLGSLAFSLGSLCEFIIPLKVAAKYRLYNEVEVSTAFIIPRAVGPRYDKAVETNTELYNLLLTCDFCPFGFVRQA